MTKGSFIRRGNTLVAADDATAEILSALPEGKEIVVPVKASRNPRQHRMFFALLNEVIKAGAWEGDTDSLLYWLKLRNRHVHVMEVNGSTIASPRSISFESMPQDKFMRFFDRSIYFICTELLADEEWEKFRDDFIARVEGPYRDQRDAA